MPAGAVLPIGPHARPVRERLIAVGMLGFVAVFLSTPITIHTALIDRAWDVAAGDHRLQVLVAHARDDAVHVGSGAAGFAIMIVAELLGSLLAIAAMICWAERHRAGDEPTHGLGTDLTARKGRSHDAVADHRSDVLVAAWHCHRRCPRRRGPPL